MAVNTSKATLGNLYRRINAELGTPISAVQMAAGVDAPNYETFEFIEAVNAIVRELAGETEMLHRIYVLRSDVGMMRYIKYTREEGEGGILRIDLDGQTATLPSGAGDAECLGVQYEKICGGDGVDFRYAGSDGQQVAPDNIVLAPDSFPKIYLPAESNIDPSVYDPTLRIARLKGAGGLSNQPALATLLDIQMVGWSTGDITDTDNYPTASGEEDFFVDPFLIAALMYLRFTSAAGNVDYPGNLPRSNDAYLNDTWATITGIASGDLTAATVNGGPTFIFDGITYTVQTVVWVDGNSFTFEITDAVSTWTYTIDLRETPWQTVATNTDRWGNLFNAGQDHAWYLKLDDHRIKLPDDVEKIEWVWKVPKSSWTEVIDEDADEDNVLTAVGDSDWFLYNPMDRRNHYFPITESLWSSVKWMQTIGYISKTYAGFYIQKGQQLRIEPKTADPIAICVQCRPDLADDTTEIDDFDDIYLEIPALGVDCIYKKMLSNYFASLRSGSMERVQYWEAMYQKDKSDLKKLYKAKMGQSVDGPVLRERFQSQRHSNAFGYSMSRIRAPYRRWDKQ